MNWVDFTNDLTIVAKVVFNFWQQFYTWINSHPVIFFGFFFVFLAPVFLWFFSLINYLILGDEITFSNISLFHRVKKDNEQAYSLYAQKRHQYELFNERYEREFGKGDTFEKFNESKAIKIGRNMKFREKNKELLYKEYAQKRKQNEEFAKRYKKENSKNDDLIEQWNNS